MGLNFSLLKDILEFLGLCVFSVFFFCLCFAVVSYGGVL